MKQNEAGTTVPLCDTLGAAIREGDRVLWTDPEMGDAQEYEVWDASREDMVRLSSEWGECEALPQECTIVSRHCA